ncbi:hypothetical protein GCM10023189_38330 [Nibrella saemangeumensis]|uniref:LamG domain-containing protein n=1 Tax=Nibrella saemangeumensis TaxID=1084526 RepID=A0ABP8N6G9_9BACT
MDIHRQSRRYLKASVFLLLLFTISCEKWSPPRAQFPLIAYYPFPGTSEDHSGNKLHGQLINGAKLGQDPLGRNNNALELDGVDDYFEIADSPLLRPESISISLWIKFKSITSTSHIFNKSTFSDNTNQQYSAFIRPPRAPQASSDPGFQLLVDANQDRACTREQPITDFVYLYEPTLRLNQWYHFVSTINRRVGKLYINGVEKAVNMNLPDLPIDNCSAGSLRFGVQSAADSDYNYLDGSMDDIRIYNRALTEAEILSLYQNYK